MTAQSRTKRTQDKRTSYQYLGGFLLTVGTGPTDYYMHAPTGVITTAMGAGTGPCATIKRDLARLPNGNLDPGDRTLRYVLERLDLPLDRTYIFTREGVAYVYAIQA